MTRAFVETLPNILLMLRKREMIKLGNFIVNSGRPLDLLIMLCVLLVFQLLYRTWWENNIISLSSPEDKLFLWPVICIIIRTIRTVHFIKIRTISKEVSFIVLVNILYVCRILSRIQPRIECRNMNVCLCTYNIIG